MVMKEGFGQGLAKFLKIFSSLMGENEIHFVVYGSLAYAAHTRKNNFPVHDIDILVSEKSLSKIKRILVKSKIKNIYSKKWHTVHAFKGKQKIEIDSAEYWYGKIPKSENIKFKNLTFNVVTKEVLKKIYRKAAIKSGEYSKEYYKKYESLKKIDDKK